MGTFALGLALRATELLTPSYLVRLSGIEISVMPILFSRGVPLLSTGLRSPRLGLASSKARSSGIVALAYTVDYDPA